MTSPQKLGFTTERTATTVLTVRCEAAARNSWEQWFLLRSDAHHDNLACDHALERQHLDLARERGAGILDFGDLFCAMQGKWDKRADQDQMRPELFGANYLDRLVNFASDFYEPYAANWILLGRGNHETSIRKKHETDLTERLSDRLTRAAGKTVFAGSYAGWVRFCFRRGNFHASRALRYTHGYGGGGPVTRDIIQSARQAVYLGGADIVVSGHTHDAWELPIMREQLNNDGLPTIEEMVFLKIPGYKDAFSEGGSWEVQKGHPPKPKGAFWIRFYRERNQAGGRDRERILFEAQRAK